MNFEIYCAKEEKKRKKNGDRKTKINFGLIN